MGDIHDPTEYHRGNSRTLFKGVSCIALVFLLLVLFYPWRSVKVLGAEVKNPFVEISQSILSALHLVPPILPSRAVQRDTSVGITGVNNQGSQETQDEDLPTR